MFNWRTIPGWISLALWFCWEFFGAWARIEFVFKKIRPEGSMMPTLSAIASSKWFSLALLVIGLVWIWWFSKPALFQGPYDSAGTNKDIHFTQKRTGFPNNTGNLYYVQEIIIQTDNIIKAPVALLVTCDGEIKSGYAQFVGKHFMTYQGIYNDQPDLFVVSWSAPAFTPEEPIIVHLTSTKAIKVIKVEQIPWTHVKG